MKLDKIEKILGINIIKELEAMPKDVLEDTIIVGEKVMKEAKEELEENPKYQELKESLKAVTSGLKEVNKHQKAIIAYCLHVLESKGDK